MVAQWYGSVISSGMTQYRFRKHMTSLCVFCASPPYFVVVGDLMGVAAPIAPALVSEGHYNL
jgi:hypothetical protein